MDNETNDSLASVYNWYRPLQIFCISPVNYNSHIKRFEPFSSNFIFNILSLISLMIYAGLFTIYSNDMYNHELKLGQLIVTIVIVITGWAQRKQLADCFNWFIEIDVKLQIFNMDRRFW